MEKKMLSIALALILMMVATMVQVAFLPTAKALTLPGPIRLDKEFSLIEGETATLVIGEPEIDRGYEYNIYLSVIIPDCMPVDPCVNIKVTGTPGFESPPETAFIDQQIVMSKGEKRTLGEGFYAIQIENTGIEPIEPGEKASFIVRSLSNEFEAKIFVFLGETFSLLESQTAVVENENLELTLDKIFVSYCTPTQCVDVIPSVLLTVKKPAREPGETGIAAEIRLGAGESTSVFGYTIENKEIASNKASFVVTKEFEEPGEIKARLGEEFLLKTSQTARIFEKSTENEIMKATLEKIVGDPNGLPFAYMTFSTSEGIKNFYVKEGKTYQIVGKYYLDVKSIGQGSGTFVVDAQETQLPDLFVNLLDNFDLKQGQKAIVQETGFEIKYAGFDAELRPCPANSDASTSKCYPRKIAKFIVTEPQSGSTIKITVPKGSSRTVFDHEITLNRIDLGVANLTITKRYSTPDTVNALLDEKFKLKESQLAYVSDNRLSIAPDGSGGVLLKLLLEKIDFYPCLAANDLDESLDKSLTKRCDSRPFARVTVSTEGAFESFVLPAGSERQVGGFGVRVLAIDVPLKSAVFIVSKAFETPYKTVYLNEKFGLEKSQTAFVKEISLFLKLNYIEILESYPKQFRANVSVWKNFVPVPMTVTAVPVTSDTDTIGTPVGTATVPPTEVGGRTTVFPDSYSLGLGKSLSFYGAEISLVEINEKTATFVVSTDDKELIINVQVNEPFWLKESQAAKVREANMRIDLLGISQTCTKGPPLQERDESSDDFQKGFELCKNAGGEVQISVSSLVSSKSDAGKKLAKEIVQEISVESADSDDGEDKKEGKPVKRILVPPTPFNIFTLREGEEITVNDYSIKALNIEFDRAEFVVKQKTIGKTVEYTIYNGWNLLSAPGEMQVQKSTCNTSEWKVFEYDSENGFFEKAGKLVPGRAYWAYNPTEVCSVSAGIRNPVSTSELESLVSGWNFVAPTFDMIGQRIEELGNCNVSAVFKWDAANSGWINATGQTVNESDIGSGFAVYSKNKCSLSKGDTPFPPFPPTGPEEPTEQ